MVDQLHLLFGLLAVLVAVVGLGPQLVVVLINAIKKSKIESRRGAWQEAAERTGLSYREGDERSSSWSLKEGRDAIVEGELRGWRLESYVRRDLASSPYRDFDFRTVADVELDSELWTGSARLIGERSSDNVTTSPITGVGIGKIVSDLLDSGTEGEPVSTGVAAIDECCRVSGVGAGYLRDTLEDPDMQTALVCLLEAVDEFELSAQILQVRIDGYIEETDEIGDFLKRAIESARRFEEAATRTESGAEEMFPDVQSCPQ